MRGIIFNQDGSISLLICGILPTRLTTYWTILQVWIKQEVILQLPRADVNARQIKRTIVDENLWEWDYNILALCLGMRRIIFKQHGTNRRLLIWPSIPSLTLHRQILQVGLTIVEMQRNMKSFFTNELTLKGLQMKRLWEWYHNIPTLCLGMRGIIYSQDGTYRRFYNLSIYGIPARLAIY